VKELTDLEERQLALSLPSSNMQYVIAVVVMMMIGVIAVTVLVVMRPDNKENLIVIGLILGFLAPTTLSLLALMKSQETHLSVNSRLDAFMNNAKLAAYAKGVTEGRSEGRISADNRTDTLAGHAPTVLDNIAENTKQTALNTETK